MSKSRAWRRAAWSVVCLAFLFVPETAHAAAPWWSADEVLAYARLELPRATPQLSAPRAAPQPFGSVSSAPLQGGLHNKWQAVKIKLRREARILKRCRSHPESCPEAAQSFLAVVDRALAHEGKNRIAEVNRAINLSIRPMDDLKLYGVPERWATPLMTFATRAGDCEDYAIAKYVALQQIGMSPDDLRLVVVHDPLTGDGHAMTAARFEGRWLVLDNQRTGLMEDTEIADAPLFLIDKHGAKRVLAFALGGGKRAPDAKPAEPVAVSWARRPAITTPL